MCWTIYDRFTYNLDHGVNFRAVIKMIDYEWNTRNYGFSQNKQINKLNKLSLKMLVWEIKMPENPKWKRITASTTTRDATIFICFFFIYFVNDFIKQFN